MISNANSMTANEEYVPFSEYEDVDFGEEAIAPPPSGGYPILQYATGLPASRSKRGREGYEIDPLTGEVEIEQITYAGFFSECGKNKELDKAMQTAGVPTVTIFHRSGEAKVHWAMEKPSVFIIAKSIPGKYSTTTGEHGIAYRPRITDEKGKTKELSTVHVQLVLKDLLPHYTTPFVLTMRSTQSEDLLKALSFQYKVLAKAHEVMRRHNVDKALPLWAFSLTLAASKVRESRGQGQNTSLIFPVVAVVPNEITTQYHRLQKIPLKHENGEDTGYSDLFKRLTEEAVEWAEAKMQQINQGVDTSEPWRDEEPPIEEHPF